MKLKLTIVLLLSAISTYGQINMDTAIIADLADDTTNYSHITIGNMGVLVSYGWYRTEKYDTTQAYLLTSKSGIIYSNAEVIYGYVIKQLHEYVGDHMCCPVPQDYWEISDYLDKDKKKFPDNIIIWQSYIQPTKPTKP